MIRRTTMLFLVTLTVILVGGGSVAHGSVGTFKIWDFAGDSDFGCCPSDTVADPTGLTGRVASAGAPLTLITYGNLASGADFPGLLYWNPSTNAFKLYITTLPEPGGLDINRFVPATGGGLFGGGDVWFTASHPPAGDVWVHLPGGDSFREFNTGQQPCQVGGGSFFSGGSGIRVDPATGKVYLANFLESVDCESQGGTNQPSKLIELDPATDQVRTWPTGNLPANFVVDDPFIYATASARGGQPDQILRLNPATNEVLRWDIPGGGLEGRCCASEPNDIEKDAAGNIWFSESDSNEIGRLRGGPDNVIGTSDDVIDEYSKSGIDSPWQLATLGGGPAVQTIFAEFGGQSVDVLTAVAATPTSTTVPPSTETPTPTSKTATHADHVFSGITKTITPTTMVVNSSDPSGIDRFPFTGGHPAGISDVVLGNSIFGSAWNYPEEGKVFQLTTDAIGSVPATLTLSPKVSSNPVDSQHCVTAKVEGASGTPIAGVTVRFSVSGSVTTSGSDITDANGEATFCYQGPALPGPDAISAYADTDDSNTQDAGEPSDTATKTWTLPSNVTPCVIKITNGGWIVTDDADRANFGGNAKETSTGTDSGHESYLDHGPAEPMDVHSLNVQAITCNSTLTQATIFGQATIDGSGSHTYRIDVQDNGEPGKGTDHYRIRLDTGYDSGDHVLRGGNVQIH
jgi:hypothetical protein